MNQHYVPKLIIEGFVDESSDGNRGVWVYQARHRQWAKRPSKRTASLDDFYSLVEPSGEREDAIELLLEQFETAFALLLQKDIAARHPIQGAPHRDDVFIVFCALLIARNPVTVEAAGDTLVREAREIVEEITASDEAFQKFRAEVEAGTGQVFPNIVEFQRLRTDFQITATKSAKLGTAIGGSAFWRNRLAQMHVDLRFAPPDSCDLTAADVRAVNRAILGSADQMIISSSREVFEQSVLDHWATADREGRIALVRTLIEQEPSV